nr:hypothetical protein [uncultured Anaeromusa sp.]
MIAVVDVDFFLIISFIVLLLASLVALLSKKIPQWQLPWRIVLFCAGCAILLAAVLPRLLLSWANLEMTIAILFACAVGGAWAAATLPDYMPAVSAATALPVASETSILPVTVTEQQQQESTVAQFRRDVPEKPLPKKEELQEQPFAARKKKPPKIQKKEPVATGVLRASSAGENRLPAKRKKQTQTMEKSVVADTSLAMVPVAEPVTAKLPNLEPEKTAPSAVDAATVAVESIAVSEDVPAASTVDSSLAEDPQEISAPENLDLAEKTEKIPTTFVNVDACLEDAWSFREAGSWQSAQKVLQAGLAQFADDEDLPFLLIEEGALLKRYGHWEEAIAALEAALALPQVSQQPVWQKDIQQTLGYLQIFLGVLRQLKLEAVAPEAIPASVLEKVETIYQQWRSRQ